VALIGIEVLPGLESNKLEEGNRVNSPGFLLDLPLKLDKLELLESHTLL
jgi:hypothetical protein